MPVSSDNNLTADISVIFPAGAMALLSELSNFHRFALAIQVQNIYEPHP